MKIYGPPNYYRIHTLTYSRSGEGETLLIIFQFIENLKNYQPACAELIAFKIKDLRNVNDTDSSNKYKSSKWDAKIEFELKT